MLITERKTLTGVVSQATDFNCLFCGYVKTGEMANEKEIKIRSRKHIFIQFFNFIKNKFQLIAMMYVDGFWISGFSSYDKILTFYISQVPVGEKFGM